MSTAQIINPASGGKQLLLNGYVYYKKYSVSGKTYWRCSSAYSHVCNATAITCQNYGGLEVLKDTEHTHPAEHGVQDEDMQAVHHEDVSGGDADYDDQDEADLAGRTIFSDHDDEDDDEDEGDADQGDHDNEGDTTEEDGENEDESSEENDVDFVRWQPWREDSDTESESEDDDDEIDWHARMRLKFKAYKVILRALGEAEPPMRAAILSKADKGLICFLCEICLNILNRAIHLTNKEVNILRPFADQVRALASTALPWREKQEALSQEDEDPTIPILLNIAWDQLT